MLILFTIYLLLSNAVNSQRDVSILNSQMCIFSIVYSMWSIYNQSYYLFMNLGISISVFNGLFYINSYTMVLYIVFFTSSALTLIIIPKAKSGIVSIIFVLLIIVTIFTTSGIYTIPLISIQICLLSLIVSELTPLLIDKEVFFYDSKDLTFYLEHLIKDIALLQVTTEHNTNQLKNRYTDKQQLAWVIYSIILWKTMLKYMIFLLIALTTLIFFIFLIGIYFGIDSIINLFLQEIPSDIAISNFGPSDGHRNIRPYPQELRPSISSVYGMRCLDYFLNPANWRPDLQQDPNINCVLRAIAATNASVTAKLAAKTAAENLGFEEGRPRMSNISAMNLSDWDINDCRVSLRNRLYRQLTPWPMHD